MDFEEVFDKVNREQIRKLVRLYSLVKLYERWTARLELAIELTKEITLENGVKQGCSLLPSLLLVIVDGC